MTLNGAVHYPDASFANIYADSPGLVIEFSHCHKDIDILVASYLGGGVKTVVVVDVQSRETKEAYLSVWHSDGSATKNSVR